MRKRHSQVISRYIWLSKKAANVTEICHNWGKDTKKLDWMVTQANKNKHDLCLWMLFTFLFFFFKLFLHQQTKAGESFTLWIHFQPYWPNDRSVMFPGDMINSFLCCAMLCPTHHVGSYWLCCICHPQSMSYGFSSVSTRMIIKSDQFKGSQESVCVCVSQCQHGYVQMSVSLILTGRHTQTRPVLPLTL